MTNNEPIQDPSMPGQAFRARADIGVGTSVCLDQSVPGNSLQKDSSVHIRASAGKDSSVIRWVVLYVFRPFRTYAFLLRFKYSNLLLGELFW